MMRLLSALVILSSAMIISNRADADTLVVIELHAKGEITLLRAQKVGRKFGEPPDEIDVEVVIKLDSKPDEAFGFKLRDDGNRSAHQGMFDLLRDAFRNDWVVNIDYQIVVNTDDGRVPKNGVITAVWISRPF